MDKRSEPRFAADQAVVVTVLGEQGSRYPARIRNYSSRGMALEMPVAVPPETPLQIEVDDSSILGEAVYCTLQQDSYLIGVELDQVLCGLAELRRRLSGFPVQEQVGR